MSANPPDTPAQPMVVTATWALAGLAFTMLLSSLSTSIANVGLPTLAEAFDTSFQAVQWVVLAYLLAITALVAACALEPGDYFAINVAQARAIRWTGCRKQARVIPSNSSNAVEAA